MASGLYALEAMRSCLYFGGVCLPLFSFMSNKNSLIFLETAMEVFL